MVHDISHQLFVVFLPSLEQCCNFLVKLELWRTVLVDPSLENAKYIFDDILSILLLAYMCLQILTTITVPWWNVFTTPLLFNFRYYTKILTLFFSNLLRDELWYKCISYHNNFSLNLHFKSFQQFLFMFDKRTNFDHRFLSLGCRFYCYLVFMQHNTFIDFDLLNWNFIVGGREGVEPLYLNALSLLHHFFVVEIL